MNKIKKISGIIILIICAVIAFSDIVPDGQTNVYVEKSDNGTTIINISTPSSKGVSDSTFKELSIDEKGAVLNNSEKISRSEIAGYINSNKNIINPARIALLRVTSKNKSEIKGILEAVSRDKIDVVIANKNGITLDGAKFLNIHDLTLTTGEVKVREGEIEDITVYEGDILSLSELNTSNVENLKILTNIARIEEDVYANNIEIKTGENLVKTYDKEIGIPISAEILGSVHGNNVKIIATKSGIGIKNIYANNIELETENDIENKEKLIGKESISISARNIVNDKNILLSKDIKLNAKEDVYNSNGAIIHADNNLKIKAKNVYNIGRVISYGNPTVNYYDLDGNKIEDIENFITRKEEIYNSYNAGRLSPTKEAKENALRAFYDEIVYLDHSEFDWRIHKDKYQAGENKKREGKPGIFYELEGSYILKKENIQEVVETNRKAMYSESSDNYAGHTEKNYIVKAKLDTENKDTLFSVLSGNNVEIEAEKTINNKDGHIIANEKNKIKGEEFNNASSINEESYLLKDGYERMNFLGEFNCPGGLIVCYIKHHAEYERGLGNEREVNVLSLPSYIKGREIEIEAEEVNFKTYKEDEVKKIVSKEDEKYINRKEEVEIKGKKVEYEIEEDPRYVSIENFYKSPYFLNNLKYNKNEYIIDEFNIQDKRIEEEEKEEKKESIIKIDAKILNVVEQKLIFDKVKLSANKVRIENAKVEAYDSIEIEKAKNVEIVASDIEADKIRVEAEDIKIEDKIEVKEEVEVDTNGELLYKKTVKTEETSKKSEIKANNGIEIVSNNLKIKGSDILTENLNIESNKVDILNSVSQNKEKTFSKLFLGLYRITEDIETKSNESNILASNVSIKSNDVKIKGSNLIVKENIDIDSENIAIESDILENKDGYNKQEVNESSNILGKNLNLKGNNVKIKGSNLTVKENIDIDSENIAIESDILENKDGYNKQEVNESSNILGKNLNLKGNNVKIKGSNLIVEENIDIKTEDLSILNSVGEYINKSNYSGSEEEKGKISNGSNILANNLKIESNKTKIQDSDVTVINDLDVKGKLEVVGDKLEYSYKKEQKEIFKKENINYETELEKGSKITVLGNTKAEDILIKGSEFNTKTLEAKEVKVEADVLETKEKVDKSSFKFVEDGYIQAEAFNYKARAEQTEKGTVTEVVKDKFEIKDLKNLRASGKVTLFSHKEEKKDNETERNKRAGLKVEEKGKIEKLDILSSDVVINNGEIKEIDVDTTVLKNSIKENKYKGGLNVSFDASLSGVNARVGIDIENTNKKGTEKINESSNISLLGESKIEEKAEFRAANLRYDELEINAKKVIFDAKKDESDITTNITGVSIGVSANISSPILNDALQIGEGTIDLLNGRVDRALSNIGNGYVSGVNNLASNLKIKDEKGEYRQAIKKDLSSGEVEKGLDGYINIGAEVGATISNRTIIEHKEEVKSGTLTGGKLKFNNNEEVKFVSTKVKDTKIEYNNVENVVKEVEVANNSKTTIDASVGVSFGVGIDAKDGSVRKGDVKVSVGFGIESEEEKINGINELENVEETFNGVGNVKLKGVVSENAKIKGKVENIEIEEVKDEKIVVGVKEGFDISISPTTGIPTGANIEYGIKDKREEKAYKNELNLEELEYGSKEVKEVEEENHNYEFGIRAGTSGVSTNFNINDKFSLDISSKTMEALTNPKGFREKIDLAKEEVESTAKGIEEGVKSLFKPENNKVDMSKEEKRNYFEAGEAYIRYKNDEKIEKIKNAKIESQEDIDKLAKEMGIEGGLKVISEEDMQKIADAQEREKALAKEGEKLGIFVIKGKDGKKYLAVTDPNQDINELKKGIAREYAINREIEEGRAKINEKGDYLAATIGNIASENIEGKEEGEIELEYTEIDDNIKNGIVISDNVVYDQYTEQYNKYIEKYLTEIKNLNIDSDDENILKHYVRNITKYYAAKHQILEWYKIRDYFEKNLDFSNIKDFMRTFRNLRGKYMKSTGNFVSYNEVLYVLGNKKAELEKIGVLYPKNKLGENEQYVKIFSKNEYRETYDNISKYEEPGYLVNPNLMTEDYKFLLKEQKELVDKIIVSSYDDFNKKASVIKNGKIESSGGIIDVEKIFNLKNGRTRTSTIAFKTLENKEGKKILDKIVVNNFKISKEEKIRTELRNTELNSIVIENTDTKEITVKIFILDRMADALDFDIFSKDNKGFDLKESNRFEIVALLDEMKFKNRSEYEKYINSKREEINKKNK